MRIDDLTLKKLARHLDMPQPVYTKNSDKAAIRIEQFFYSEIFKISMAVRDVLRRSDFQVSVGRYGGVPCFERGEYKKRLSNKRGDALARFLSCIREHQVSLKLLPPYLQFDPLVYNFLLLCHEYNGILFAPFSAPISQSAIICESVNMLLADLRSRCGDDLVTSSRKNVQRLSNLNADSTFSFLCKVCQQHSMVRIARLNLYPALSDGKCFDPKSGVTEFKRFLKNKIDPVKSHLAYLWHLEYAVTGDVYFHLVLIMQLQAEGDWKGVAKAIGNAWVQEFREGVRGFALCADPMVTRRVKKEDKTEKVQTAYPTFQSIGTGDHLTADETFRKKLKAIAVSLTQQERFFRFIELVQQGDIGSNGEESPVTKKKGKRSYVVLGRKKLV